MKINPYLNFNGQCEAAFKFYAETLGGKIDAMATWGDSPMRDDVPAEWHNRIIHTQLEVDGMILMGSDAPPNYYEEPKGLSVTVNVDDPAEAERLFGALAENGRITMPIEKTFWAERFGMATDKFGIPWMVNCSLTES